MQLWWQMCHMGNGAGSISLQVGKKRRFALQKGKTLRTWKEKHIPSGIMSTLLHW